jgi:hypothetical protein
MQNCDAFYHDSILREFLGFLIKLIFVVIVYISHGFRWVGLFHDCDKIMAPVHLRFFVIYLFSEKTSSYGDCVIYYPNWYFIFNREIIIACDYGIQCDILIHVCIMY